MTPALEPRNAGFEAAIVLQTVSNLPGGLLLRSLLLRSSIALATVCLALIPCAPAAGRKPAAAPAPAAAALENFTGEYTDPAAPDTPISFYEQNGRLVAESERSVPAELTQTGTTEFAVPGSKISFRFGVDGAGRGISVVESAEPA
jgi:hypothetical protein